MIDLHSAYSRVTHQPNLYVLESNRIISRVYGKEAKTNAFMPWVVTVIMSIYV